MYSVTFGYIQLGLYNLDFQDCDDVLKILRFLNSNYESMIEHYLRCSQHGINCISQRE